MMTVRERRRRANIAKLAVVAVTAAIVLTPKDIAFPEGFSVPLVAQAMASE